MNKLITVKDFIELHIDFVREKQFENLSERTISDHKCSLDTSLNGFYSPTGLNQTNVSINQFSWTTRSI